MTDLPDEAVDAAARARYARVRLDRDGEAPEWDDLAPQHREGWRDGVRNEIAAAAPHIAAQATRDVRAERDSILRRIERLHDESWWVGGAWGDYGEAVIPLRAISTLTGPLADAGPEWETRPGFAATWGDLRATVERQESELADLRAGIEALRDEWQGDSASADRNAGALDAQRMPDSAQTERDYATTLRSHADALDALVGGAK